MLAESAQILNSQSLAPPSILKYCVLAVIDDPELGSLVAIAVVFVEIFEVLLEIFVEFVEIFEVFVEIFEVLVEIFEVFVDISPARTASAEIRATVSLPRFVASVVILLSNVARSKPSTRPTLVISLACISRSDLHSSEFVPKLL